MAKGFRMDRAPAGADALNYRPGIKRERQTNAQARAAAYDALSPAEKAEQRQEFDQYEADMAQWKKDFAEHGPTEAGEMLIKRRAERGTDKIADFYARRMVEGDTDLNHDNVEAADV